MDPTTTRDDQAPPADAATGEDGLTILLNAPVRFGLESQGHIPTVERMLDEGRDWTAIGLHIGWHPLTAWQHYTDWLRSQVAGLRAQVRIRQDGEDAASAGRDERDNPYAEGSAEFGWWHRGYWGERHAREAGALRREREEIRQMLVEAMPPEMRDGTDLLTALGFVLQTLRRAAAPDQWREADYLLSLAAPPPAGTLANPPTLEDDR